MKKSTTEFQNEIKAFDVEIKNYYAAFCKKKEIADRALISDGIVNIEEYFNSKIKILWVLKEAYDSDGKSNGEIQGNWSLTEIMGKPNFLDLVGRSRKTWEPIVYASWGILNDFAKYDDMDYIRDKPEMVSILRKIAFINIQKIAAESTSKNSLIEKSYNQHRNILLKQIEIYKPDIIIGGNTAHLFKQDYNFIPNEIIYDEFEFWINNGILFINANHPSQRVTEEVKAENIDTIVRIAEKHIKNILAHPVTS